MSMNNKKSLSFMKEMKNILRSRLMTAAAITAGLALAACQSDNEVETPQQSSKSTPCEISATMTGETRATTMPGENTLSTVFNTNDVIYVKNLTKGTVDSGTLTPADNNSTETTLKGILEGAYDATDKLSFLMSPGTIDPTNIRYDDQDGTQESMLAHCFAQSNDPVEVFDVTTKITTSGTAKFMPMQALFRIKLKIMDNGVDKTSAMPADAKLVIQSTSQELYEGYNFADGTKKGDNRLTLSGIDISSGEIYLALPMGDAAYTDLVFTVLTPGNTYTGVKPKDGGFANGTYYHMSKPVELHNRLQPTIVKNSGDDWYYFNESGRYNWAAGQTANITISGTSANVSFSPNGGGKVTLNSTTGYMYQANAQYLRIDNPLELVLEGNNTIECPNSDQYCIYNSVMITLTTTTTGTLNLRCKSNSDTFKGFFSAANVQTDVTCTMDEPTCTDNGDGTYTWTWKVDRQP